LYEKGIYHLFYRAVDKDWRSSIGYAISPDGEKFVREPEPLLKREYDYERQGVEDSRITKINNSYYLTYTAYDSHTARLALATSPDLKHWQKHGPILSGWNYQAAGGFNVSWDPARQDLLSRSDWSKSGAIFPKLIQGQYWMLFGDSVIWLAQSLDGIKWRLEMKPFLKPRAGDFFDNVHIEMGPAPILTDQGWLVIYHGINNKIEYQLGFMILDKNNPRHIIYRNATPIFSPQKSYEISGLVDILPGGFRALKKLSKKEMTFFIKRQEQLGGMPKVVFCCGAVVVNGLLRIYYGAADSVICTATVKLSELLNYA